MRQLFIDLSGVSHAAQHANGGKLFAGGRETTAIFGTMRSLHKLLIVHHSHKAALLIDGRSWRNQRFTDYKANRTDSVEKIKLREEYRSQRAEIARGLRLLGLPQISAINMEADDIAGILTRRAVSRGEEILLISGDKDWQQLVCPTVSWLDPRTDKLCNHENFHEITGYRTQRSFIDAKALTGDTGDNVPGCGGIGDKGALDLLSVYETVGHFQSLSTYDANDMWAAAGHKKLPQKYLNLRDDQATIDRFNFALEMMDLGHPAIPTPIDLKVKRSPVDKEGFKLFCAELNFTSFLSRIDDFLRPFFQLEKEFYS